MNQLSVEELETIIKQELPYYQSEDRDDYVYLARGVDVTRAARKIAAALRATNPYYCGQAACMRHEPANNNPYQQGSSEWDSWDQGWKFEWAKRPRKLEEAL